MEKPLKRKRFRIKDEDGNLIGDITAVSMVSKPAIERDFKLFDSIELPSGNVISFADVMPDHLQFKTTSKEKMQVTGAAMIPNTDILRFDEETKEYYNCFFTEDDIRDYAEVYLKECNHTAANFEHKNNFTKDFFVVESWIVEDPKNDKSNALGFTDIPKGTWFITYKTYNVELWNQLKESEISGFSVEIELNEFKDVENDLVDILEDLTFTKAEKVIASFEIALYQNYHSFLNVGEVSFADYPEAAVLNAQRALEYKTNNPESVCGNKLMWQRCKQIANKKPLSYSNLKRISLNIKHESKANASDYENGCSKLMYDALGGGDLVYWSINKLQQLDVLIKTEAERQNPYRRKFKATKKTKKTWKIKVKSKKQTK
jgi:hypothetical protein